MYWCFSEMSVHICCGTWKSQKDRNLNASEQLLHIFKDLCPGQGPENGSNKFLLIIHFFLSAVYLVHKLGRRKGHSLLVYSHLFQLLSNYAYIHILPYRHAADFLPSFFLPIFWGIIFKWYFNVVIQLNTLYKGVCMNCWTYKV